MANTFAHYAGRYKLDHVKVTTQNGTYDISEFVPEFAVYSSILDTSNVCRLVVIDARNFLSNAPLKGGDVVEILLSYLDQKKQMTFVVASIEDIQNEESQRAYVITCISSLAYHSNYMKISKHYVGTTSEIAQTIFNKYSAEGAATWVPSLGNQNIIIPNWSPIKAISWLADRSRYENDAVRFKFFQGSDQKYRFQPIEFALDQYKDDPPMTYSYFKNTQRVLRNGQELPNSAADMFSIEHVEYHDAFNITTALRDGMFAGRRYGIDYTRKHMNIVNYDYFEQYKADRYLNPLPIYDTKALAPGKLDYDMTPSGIATNIAGANRVDDVSSIKRSALKGGQTISIHIKGNQAIGIGQVINVEIPSPEPKTREMRDQLDLNWSGKYYVVGMRDAYTNGNQSIVLDLTKESLMAGAA